MARKDTMVYSANRLIVFGEGGEGDGRREGMLGELAWQPQQASAPVSPRDHLNFSGLASGSYLFKI